MRFIDGFIGHEPDKIFNSRGHRCKELEDVNLHNYVLFAGDNVAVDYSNPIEKTYPYLIAQKLNTDYYNLAIFNGGVECLKFNLLTWLSKIPQRPKAIIISSEFLNSFLVADQNYENIRPCSFDDEFTTDIFNSGNYNGFFNGRNELFDRILSVAVTTPVYQIVFEGKQPALSRNVVNIQHDGNMFDHSHTSDLVVSKIKNRARAIAP
jgi:hypothetical protein